MRRQQLLPESSSSVDRVRSLREEEEKSQEVQDQFGERDWEADGVEDPMVDDWACRSRIATHAMCEANPSSQGAVVVVLVEFRSNCLRSLDVVNDLGALHRSSRCLGRRHLLGV